MPGPLRAGDQVALVSPAGGPSAEPLAVGIAMLEEWGLAVHHSGLDPLGYLAGDHRARLEQVQRAFDDPTISAVLCTRGGVGTQRIVDQIDIGQFVRRRGVFVGFSDVTALHARLNSAGLVTFHGPALAWDAEHNGELARESLRGALFATGGTTLESDPDDPLTAPSQPGAVVGRLVGGNLTLLATSCGTPTQAHVEDNILFIEETGERPE